MWLAICTAVVGYVPKGTFKRWLNERVSIMCFQVLSSALSSVITYHNVENKPKTGICVANHTSPIDCLVVACDNCYSLVRRFFFFFFLFLFTYSFSFSLSSSVSVVFLYCLTYLPFTVLLRLLLCTFQRSYF